MTELYNKIMLSRAENIDDAAFHTIGVAEKAQFMWDCSSSAADIAALFSNPNGNYKDKENEAILRLIGIRQALTEWLNPIVPHDTKFTFRADDEVEAAMEVTKITLAYFGETIKEKEDDKLQQ